MTLRLRGTFAPNPRVEPLIDGTVKPKGIEIVWDRGNPAHLHEHHLRHSDYDVFEFSISNYMITRERKNDLWDWTALPVFFSKATLGLRTYVNRYSGIVSAADLRWKRFGVPDYTMTAALWFRAQLRELYGIPPQDMEWYVGRVGERSHGAQMGMRKDPPSGVKLFWTKEGELNRLLQSGGIDAAFPSVDSDVQTDTGNVRPLFDDGGRRFMADFQRKAGFLPVNHTVVVQRKLLEREPWAAEALFEAFEISKREAYRRNPSHAMVFPRGNDFAWQESVFGADPYVSGLAANLPMLQMAAAQSNLDGLTRQKVDVEQLYWESLRAT